MIRTVLQVLLLATTVASMVNAQLQVTSSPRRFVETHLAVNPTDHKNIIGVAISRLDPTLNQIAAMVTHDGGSSWTTIDPILTNGMGNDPTIAIDPDGIAYVLFQTTGQDTLRLVKSTDGGDTWSFLSNVIIGGHAQFDRPMLTVSPVRNSAGYYPLFASFTDFTLEAGVNLFRSVDGGSSWAQVCHKFSTTSYGYHGTSVAAGLSG